MGQFIEDIFRLQQGAVDPGQAVNFRKDMLSELSCFIKSAQCEKTVIPRVGNIADQTAVIIFLFRHLKPLFRQIGDTDAVRNLRVDFHRNPEGAFCGRISDQFQGIGAVIIDKTLQRDSVGEGKSDAAYSHQIAENMQVRIVSAQQ